MNRRTFLGHGLIAGTSAGLGACAVPTTAPSANELPPANQTSRLPSALENLLRDAARAPSSHNSQPWRILIQSAQRWCLQRDDSRSLPAVDPRKREAWISLGAFHAALETSARARGMRVDTQNLDIASNTIDIAWSAAPHDTEWLTALRSRRCLRRNLAATPIDTQFLSAASTVMGAECGFIPSGSTEAESIARYTMDAESRQQGVDVIWEELADWIRWNDEATHRHQTGLTPAGMELPYLIRLWVAAWYDRAEVIAPAFRARSLLLCNQQVKEGAGWLLITTPHDDPESWLAAGRCLMRVWLACSRMELALHPMSQSLEVDSLREALGNELSRGYVQMILRIGKPPRLAPPVSPRLDPFKFAMFI